MHQTMAQSPAVNDEDANSNVCRKDMQCVARDIIDQRLAILRVAS